MQTNENQLSAGYARTHEMIQNLALSQAKLAEQNRSRIDHALEVPSKWEGVEDILYSNNPDKAEDFLVRLLKIPAEASESEKADALLSILNEYSDHSVSHSAEVEKFIREIGRLKDFLRFDAFKNIDFEALALAMKRHDVGKLGMPDRILNPPKPIKYTDADNKVKEAHPVLGYFILKSLNFSEKSQRLALTHHLKYKTQANGDLKIVGYPVDDFIKYSTERGETPELTAEDHLAAFADVFSALTDPKRKSNVEGTNSIQSIEERYESAFIAMEEEDVPKDKRKYFGDDFYTKGKGLPLYLAFKKAMYELLEHENQEVAAA